MKNACHLVCYYRYVRFLADGRLFYRTSPEILTKVARRLADAHAQQGRRKDDAVQEGRYRCQVRYKSRGFGCLQCLPSDLRSSYSGSCHWFQPYSCTSYPLTLGTGADVEASQNRDVKYLVSLINCTHGNCFQLYTSTGCTSVFTSGPCRPSDAS